MEPPSQIMLPYFEQSANIVHNEASHLLVNCSLLTNKRSAYLYNFGVTGREYGNADKRFLVSDPTIVSMAFPTVIVCGPLCLLLIASIVRQHHSRHWLQVALCICELYGGEIFIRWYLYLCGNFARSPVFLQIKIISMQVIIIICVL